ncbi:SseB family protein [Planctomonas psychrotolerans]|uniref:SseB family protein n=1 Tax=Planctomonas psychrotolerans TaxID=2528712 RepID=UPI00123A8D44|nr:SseB family protein [Planctomonas psychrotolerans]
MEVAADSAGRPWAGRSFEPTAHADDDGSAPPLLIRALESFRAGNGSESDVVDVLRSTRLLIPLVAALGDGGVGETGLRVDKSADLSIVTVSGPDGRTVLPVFSSVDAMRAWNPRARPIPADGIRVALAAASEGTDLVVLDATSPGEFVLRRPALWAIAQSEVWTPSYQDPAVEQEFLAACADEPAVRGVALAAGDPDARLAGPEVVVTLQLEPGLDRDALAALLGRLQQRWSESELIAARVDSLRVTLAAADDTRIS